MPSGPRVLVTGFEPFPGAPVNPTEWLIVQWREEPPAFDGISALHAEVLPVDYEALPRRLAGLGSDGGYDIAIHFGLSGKATGFTLERVAQNVIGDAKPDNSGVLPVPKPIHEAGDNLSSGLPLASIAASLEAASHPVVWSDDAGTYLCNYLFYLSRSSHFPVFSPRMSGFVHVPLAGEGHPLSSEDLLSGAAIVVETCIAQWNGAQGA